jgi:branched-subunit amino acid permease
MKKYGLPRTFATAFIMAVFPMPGLPNKRIAIFFLLAYFAATMVSVIFSFTASSL